MEQFNTSPNLWNNRTMALPVLMDKDSRHCQKGNALFLILIAVALFAALSYAITQSGKGSGTIDKEQSLIKAAQITQFPATVRSAVNRLVLTGTAITSIDFAVNAVSSNSDAVFSASGGGVIVQTPPITGGTASYWGFASTDGTNGYHIAGIGTDTAGSGQDVFAYLDGISLSICQAINKGLGLSSTPSQETVAVVLTTDPITHLATAGGAGDGTAARANVFYARHASPQSFACNENTTGGNYVYYHTLYEQ